ncbi:porin family protein [Flavobacterium sp. CFBP9031]|uniref:porin family protein n=1 Tax=Flavobacterium sp. CFBP9031 TaxID=3096538 RepID=UPI002A6A7C4E|nr:porin family protein [Flavobacterium sp. CFBP9031]MDY0986668.1 porin family protein [Flavobacterium sp. CFBP9031]
MKKIITLISLFIMTVTNAQLHIGAKAGANLNKINGNSFDDKFELGYQAGGFIYVDISSAIGLQGEVLFNQTNTTIEDSYSDVVNNAFKGKKSLNYISVPILLRINNEGFITFTAGPQFSFLADSEKSLKENGKKIFNNTDFAAVAGAEINLHPLIIYGRYSWGFSDISDFGGRSNSQQIQVGLALRLF